MAQRFEQRRKPSRSRSVQGDRAVARERGDHGDVDRHRLAELERSAPRSVREHVSRPSPPAGRARWRSGRPGAGARGAPAAARARAASDRRPGRRSVRARRDRGRSRTTRAGPARARARARCAAACRTPRARPRAPGSRSRCRWDRTPARVLLPPTSPRRAARHRRAAGGNPPPGAPPDLRRPSRLRSVPSWACRRRRSSGDSCRRAASSRAVWLKRRLSSFAIKIPRCSSSVRLRNGDGTRSSWASATQCSTESGPLCTHSASASRRPSGLSCAMRRSSA